MIENIMNKRIKSLNGLKVFGYLCVYTSHAHLMLRNKFSVTLFFMISGFLLYYSHNNSMSDKKVELLNFSETVRYVFSHIRRIYPIYLFFFFVSILTRKSEMELLFKDSRGGLLVFQHVCMLQSLTLQPFQFNYAAWYISCLFILYWLTLPGIYWVKKVKSPVKCISITIILYYILDYYILKYAPVFDFSYWNPFYRYPVFLIGMLTGRLFCEIDLEKGVTGVCEILNYNRRQTDRLLTSMFNFLDSGIVLAFTIMLLIQFNIPESNNYFTLLFAVALYILAFDKGWLCNLLNGSYVQWLSKIGLEFYLCHELILFVVENYLKKFELSYGRTNILLWIIAMPISLVVAFGVNQVYQMIQIWRVKND